MDYLKLRHNTDLRIALEKRALILAKIREFFRHKDFLEVDTPILVNLPGMEPYLDVFKTRFEDLNGHGKDMYLITSPEYAMKKLLVGGLPKIFQLTRSFRNKETGGDLHNPEFTILEWYRANANYRDIMRDTEELLLFLAKEVLGKESLTYEGVKVDLSQGFEHIAVVEAFERFANVPREIFEHEELLVVEAKKRGYSIGSGTYDDAFYIIFLNEIEGKLGLERPVILYDYPVSMAALSKVSARDSRYAERFEVYIAGMELANAFSELTDPVEQRKRLEEERGQRKKLGKLVYDVDMSFIKALELGMPESGGIALGVDRLIMLLLDKPTIEDVMAFSFEDLSS